MDDFTRELILHLEVEQAHADIAAGFAKLRAALEPVKPERVYSPEQQLAMFIAQNDALNPYLQGLGGWSPLNSMTGAAWANGLL